MDEESNMHMEEGANDIVLGDSWVRDLGIEPSNIRKLRTRKRVVMCYPGAAIDFIQDKLEIVHGSRGVIIHVGDKIATEIWMERLKGQEYY